jgi:hypothetical protein
VTGGFYKRRRGIVEHIEAGTVDLLESGIHDYLCLKANLVIGNGFPFPAGVCFTSAPAIHARCRRRVSLRTVQRVFRHLEKIGWIKTWPGECGNYATLICRASVHDMAGNEYRVNGVKTTDWRHPVYEPVAPQSQVGRATVAEMAGNREQRKEKREKQNKAFTLLARAAFCAKYGVSPSWQGKDWKCLQNLLASNKTLSLDELQARWNNYLESTDTFTANQGGSLGYFCLHADVFISGPISYPTRGGQNGKTSLADAVETTLTSHVRFEGTAN